jgi:hypothetical protein
VSNLIHIPLDWQLSVVNGKMVLIVAKENDISKIDY